MLKKILAAMLAASLTVQPVRADVPPREPAKQQFCKAVIGIDDAVIIGLSARIVVYSAWSTYRSWAYRDEIDRLKGEVEKAKAERCS
jgi:hypothetical protein